MRLLAAGLVEFDLGAGVVVLVVLGVVALEAVALSVLFASSEVALVWLEAVALLSGLVSLLSLVLLVV